jgi:hypothetical protein
MRAQLILVLAIACHTADSPQAKPMPESTTQITQVRPQRNPTRLVVARTRIAFLGNDQVTLTETAPAHSVTVKLPGARSIGTLGDDIAVATFAAGKTALVRFAPGSDTGAARDGLLSVPSQGTGRIAAGAVATEFYMAKPNELARERIDADRIVPIQVIAWKADQLRTFAPLAGGRVAFVDGGVIAVLGPGDHRAAFAEHPSWALLSHIAAGPAAAGGDQLWITKDDQLALAALRDGAVKPGPPIALGAPAYHLSSAGDFAAVLAASGAGKFVGEVIVVGSDGRVRWRAKLPAAAAMDAYIAASADVVAVQLADQLFAWHAGDGAPIALPPH